MWKKSEPQESNSQPSSAPPAQPIAASRNSDHPRRSKEHAVIGPAISIKGDLTGDEDLVIEGRVEGKIELPRHSVTIGKEGAIKADIHGRIITVEGTVEGNLYGDEQLIVRQSGTVHGNIVAPRVTLEDGCSFKGNIDMSSKEKPGASFHEDLPVIS